MKYLFLAAEGVCDVAACRKMAEAAGWVVANEFNSRGKGRLDKRLPGYVEAARCGAWFVVRDLDHDAECAFDLKKKLVGEIQARQFRTFRIAVRSMEAWIMADFKRVATWLKVSEVNVPREPERLDDPKAELSRLAIRSRSRSLREMMAPDPQSGAGVGPQYEAALSQFINSAWEPHRAASTGRAPSLSRAITALETLRSG